MSASPLPHCPGGGVLRDDRGRIVVREFMSRLRWYDPQGVHLRTLDFMGGGPGEIQGTSRLLPYRGDSLIVVGTFRGSGPAIPGAVPRPGAVLPERSAFSEVRIFDQEGAFGRAAVIWTEAASRTDSMHVVGGGCPGEPIPRAPARSGRGAPRRRGGPGGCSGEPLAGGGPDHLRDPGVGSEERKLEGGPTRWTVFSPEGLPLGSVHTPAGLTVHQIGDDYLLGVIADELGVQRIRMYALEEPDG